MGTQLFNRHTTWTVFFSLLIALGLGACSDVSNAPAPAAGPTPLALLTAAPLPDGTEGGNYNITLTPSGGSPSYTWSLAAGSPQLPTGLSLNPSTGAITGTPTSATGGPTNTEFKLVDSKGASVQKVLPITVNLAPVPLAIVTSSLQNGSINQLYAFALSPNGGTSPYTWALKAGSLPLPDGLTLSSGGIISGTPTVTSNASHTFTLTDQTSLTIEKTLQLVIDANPLSITTGSLPQATANQNYSATLAATGGTGSYTWGLAGGSPALPTGLTLNSSTGAITGIPANTSSLTYTFTVTDQTPPTPQTAPKTLQLIVGSAPPALVITAPAGTTLPTGSVGSAYSTSLTAGGGTGAQTWSIISGTLPNGLSLTASTGAITGTPQIGSNGTTPLTIRVQDSGAPQQSEQKAVSITIDPSAPPNITTTSLSSGTFNVGYNQPVSVTGGFGTLVWGVTSGALPPGLNLNTSNGTISGIPTSTGSFTFTLHVTDSIPQADDQPLTITINSPAPPTINSFTLPTGVVNQLYTNTQLTASNNGAQPYTWSVTPALPNGLGLNPNTGVISGTPLSGSNGVTSHTFTVTDSTLPTHQASSTVPKSLTINANVTPVTVSTSSLPSGTVGIAYTAPLLAASGGTGPYNWSLNSGSSLPAGLSVDAAGAITGTPTGQGTISTTFKVLDSTSPNQQSATRSISITINAAPPPLNITTTTLPNGTFDQTYNQTLVATGGTPSYTWSLASGTPPAGLILGTDGVLSGTPTGVGTSNFTVQVTDSLSQTDTQTLSLTIVPPGPPTITTTTLPNGTVGVAYLESLQHTGGTAPLTWGLAGGTVLPDGLSLGTDGSISGTPTTTEISNFTVEITDTFLQSDTQVLSITVD